MLQDNVFAFIILIFQFLIISVGLDFKRSSYQDYIFPIGWEIGGSFLSLISIMAVPVTAVLKILSTNSKLSVIEVWMCNFLDRFNHAFGPFHQEGSDRVLYLF